MPVIIEILTDEEPEPARRLAQLVDDGLVGRFVEAITAARGAWYAICALEQDLVGLEKVNRSAGVTAGWEIVVGPCPALAPVPGYLGWGEVSAWLENGGYAFTIEGACVEVRTAAALREELAAVPLARSGFGETSGQRINHAIGVAQEVETLFREDGAGFDD